MPTLLLVDDSENDLFLLRMAFKKAAFDVPLREVYDGQEAIAYLQGMGRYGDREQFPLPSVMLLDLNMPMMGGLEILAWLRKQPVLKRLTVVVMTASMRKEDVDQAFDLGANAFVVKPAEIEELVTVIRSLGAWMKSCEFPKLSGKVR